MREPLLRTDLVPLHMVRGRRQVIREGCAAKVAGEEMRDVLYRNWLDVPEIVPVP